MAQGCVSPLIGTTRYRWPELLKSCGLSDRVGRGGLAGAGWGAADSRHRQERDAYDHCRTMFQRRHITLLMCVRILLCSGQPYAIGFPALT